MRGETCGGGGGGVGVGMALAGGKPTSPTSSLEKSQEKGRGAGEDGAGSFGGAAEDLEETLEREELPTAPAFC